MNLAQIIYETEKLGCQIVFLDNLNCKGRFHKQNKQSFIFVKQSLSDIEKINVILHEKSHLKHKDIENYLTYIPTYSYRIEKQAEHDRIIDFMTLLNAEHPIEKDFDYLNYMKQAFIPSKYENLVKRTAQELYYQNKQK